MKLISYDEQNGTLVVELPGFSHYEVFDVPGAVFEELNKSENSKEFFNTEIWGNKYEHDSHWENLTSLLTYMGKHLGFEPPITVCSRAYDNDTPPHVACDWGDIGAIDLLIAAGADVNAKGDMDTTPLFEAVSFGHIRSAERLLKEGATADQPNELGYTAREIASQSGIPKLVALFKKP